MGVQPIGLVPDGCQLLQQHVKHLLEHAADKQLSKPRQAATMTVTTTIARTSKNVDNRNHGKDSNVHEPSQCKRNIYFRHSRHHQTTGIVNQKRLADDTHELAARYRKPLYIHIYIYMYYI